MFGFEYGDQDRKAAVLYKYETFKATEGELLLDTYIQYLQVINDLKKCGYLKDNFELNFKFLNNLQLEWKQYATMMRQDKNLMDINIDAIYNILKQKQGDVNDAMGLKKKTIVVTSDPLALIAKKTKVSKSKEKVVVSSDSEGSDADDFSELKKITALLTKMLLAKKDKDEQVLLAEDQVWMESSSDLNQEINANMVFMAQIEKVLLDSEDSTTSVDDKISEVSYYISEFKSESEYETLEYYDNTITYEKIIIDLEDEVVSLLEKEKKNLKTIESLKSKDVETGVVSSEKVVSETENKSENDCQEIEKVCDREENPNVISPGMFKLSVSQSILPISVTKMSCASNGVENLDTLSSIRRPNPSGVIWMRKGSSNTIKVDLSSVNHFTLNKNIKNALCNTRMNACVDVNDLFVFDDVNIRKSHVSKMPFRKKPCDSLNVCSKSNSSKYLPKTVHRWLPKMQPLAELIAKWILKIVQICLWIIDSGCSKHMTGNRSLLKNFVETFLGTVRFGNNDFVVIAGYGDMVIGSMTIKKSTCFVQKEDGVDLLTGDRSSNLYTIALNEVTSNSSACLLAKASCLQSWLWHQQTSKKELEDLFQKIYDEYFDSSKTMKYSTTNVETSNVEIPSNEEEVFHESSESFQEESSLSSLNDDVQQSSEEVRVPSSNTQSVSNNMIPNVDEASTSHNVFNERLEDAYFDTKDHPLYKIIGDPKSSVRTRCQLAISCLFSCFLSSIEPVNVAEALRDSDWVSAMQDELDQFARLKV
uniref:Integrase, catalytic region, zinc finger, CCHC-type, peptidase aspartic, catalytic n=1 Tax=Tanacetum cinerariifolium TaxID=118510 RepID=A0A6L2L5L9_TANCI|nr:integrase, catalytic region, zinc finger, CCHC-type, peptidase aspartic, catalytic [Tanacetum cinerariifolium]